MSARQLSPEEWWEIQFAYPGKTQKQWRSIATVNGTEREAEQQAQQLFCKDQEAAVDFMIVPLE